MTTSAFAQRAAEEGLKRTEQAAQAGQYSLWQILGIWASAALPMGLIFWAIMPILMVLGLVWQGIVAYIVLRLFSAYHLHYLWTTPSRLLINWIYAWPTKRFKSYWMGVVIHGSDAAFLIYMFILAIKGLV